MEFLQAHLPDQIDSTRELFREYEAWVEVDLCFQSFEQELAALPGKYAPPDGRLLLAYQDGQLAGCVALRKIEDGVCEMKRLFVRPAFHGKGLGRKLIESILSEARDLGYKRMRLDTLPPRMNKAIALYRRLGFREIEPYYDNPVEGALFMELDL
jgi:GNAT superfamily N-acetyltransferase